MTDTAIGNRISGNKENLIQNSESKQKKIEEEKLKKACANFESLFIYQLLKSMRNTVPLGDPSLKSFGKETYNMLFDQKIAEEMSNKGQGIGLQKMLFNQLNKSYSK